jgi:7,8-dihydropterin-6-yl-methyl-4-(beta-D-ribofuranosyl)aminobenzene 5'-phosphate synthase
MNVILKEQDKIEILTLMDNYIDVTAGDSSQIIQRAMPLKNMEFRTSILAEHGFSSLVTVSDSDQSRSVLFDFGFSEHGAAYNAEKLDANLNQIEIMALSHGHLDHTGGLLQLCEKVGKKGIKLVLHPAALMKSRYIKITDDFKIGMPSLTDEQIAQSGVEIVETREPYGLLDDTVCYLGEVPRKTDFEKGAANLKFLENDVEKQDPIKDDTALVANIKGKGLVILSGCAHSGIINTINYAKEITGVEKIHAVMGGFHLSGQGMELVIEATAKALKELDPDYIVPTHCTGRKAVMEIEKMMPEKFILNMAGTKLTFAS